MGVLISIIMGRLHCTRGTVHSSPPATPVASLKTKDGHFNDVLDVGQFTLRFKTALSLVCRPQTAARTVYCKHLVTFIKGSQLRFVDSSHPHSCRIANPNRKDGIHAENSTATTVPIRALLRVSFVSCNLVPIPLVTKKRMRARARARSRARSLKCAT